MIQFHLLEKYVAVNQRPYDGLCLVSKISDQTSSLPPPLCTQMYWFGTSNA